MSIHTIHLRKLLQFCGLDERRTVSALRREAYQDRRRLELPTEGGGDFFAPFWSDAKAYVTHGLNLTDATDDRIIRNARRERLYPVLRDRFIEWWDVQLRSTNQLLVPIEERVHARVELGELNITVKVDNLLALQVGRAQHRLIYPYFCETPALAPRWARVGLWVMTQALEGNELQHMQILDLQRGRSFSAITTPLRGNEEELLTERCAELVQIWNEIVAEA